MECSYFALVLTVLALAFAYFLRKRREHFSLFERAGIEGPPPSVIWGNIWEIYTKSHKTCQKEWHEKYGPVVGYFFGYQPTLLISDGEILKNVLFKDFHNFADRGALMGRVDRNFGALTELRGQRWKEVRSTLTPSFTSSKLKQLCPEVIHIVDDFMENVDAAHVNGKEFDMYELYKGLTLDTICRSALGVDFEIQKNIAESRILHAIKALFNSPMNYLTVALACFHDIRRIGGSMVSRIFLRLGNKGRDPVNELLVRCEEVVKLRRSNPENRRVDLLQLMIDAQGSESNADISALIAGDDAERHQAQQEKGKTLGQCPISKSKGLTDKEITANAFLVLAAGYETTSSSLAFITRVLLRFPEVQERLREELLEATNGGQVFEFEKLQKCRFMESFIQEVLRMYPPIHSFTSRYANEQKIYGDLTVPQGVDVLASTIALHYNEEVFPNPWEFQPTRFLPENKSVAMSWAWQPFGAGPRNCIGMRFAQMEIKITLAKLLTKYRLSCDSEPKGDIQIPTMDRPALQQIRDPLMVKTTFI
ncbi:cytochrome P450 3A6-like [Galendromus occidentalis]|uniref:Cytochrome P450 3A6-like n=1 Tax=Galendromus occidentalis TaxID=34638 RepID=A0AAJ6QTX5_9ACAR|nr:cytochrome P450 3A6-like [Galendromus occidentalis]